MIIQAHGSYGLITSVPASSLPPEQQQEWIYFRYRKGLSILMGMTNLFLKNILRSLPKSSCRVPSGQILPQNVLLKTMQEQKQLLKVLIVKICPFKESSAPYKAIQRFKSSERAEGVNRSNLYFPSERMH